MSEQHAVEHSMHVSGPAWAAAPAAAVRQFVARRLDAHVEPTLERLLTTARWAALAIGVMLTLPTVDAGSARLAIPASLAAFAAVWRTMRPLDVRHVLRPVAAELAVLLLAVVVSGGWNSPFAVPLGVAVFATGATAGAAVGVLAWSVSLGVTIAAGVTAGEVAPSQPSAATAIGLPLLGTLLAALGARRLSELEQKRREAQRQITLLQGTNRALVELTEAARAGSSLDPLDTTGDVVQRLAAAFPQAEVGVYLSDGDGWTLTRLDGQEHLAHRPTGSAGESFETGRRVFTAGPGPLTLADGWGAGLYQPLVCRGGVVGVMVVERTGRHAFGDADLESVDLLGQALALTVDNLTWLRRLRTLGAEDERNRLARDLHDRLGQWYAFIAFEIERIIHTDERARKEALANLLTNARGAVSELRDTLWQLRSTITEDEGFEDVGGEVAKRFSDRTGIPVAFEADTKGRRLPARVELEVLRIMQEAINNVERHARASKVTVRWVVESTRPARASLEVSDDGRGFDHAATTRPTSYGLLGMRERADAIGGDLAITSSRGGGTTVLLRIKDLTMRGL